jgi:hypothetical protein
MVEDLQLPICVIFGFSTRLSMIEPLRFIHSTRDELRTLTQEGVLDDLATALEKTCSTQGLFPQT